MLRRNFGLIGALCLGLAGILWKFSPIHPLPTGVLIAVPLVLFLPGYVLTQAFVSRWSTPAPWDAMPQMWAAEGQAFGPPDHLVISIGLSLIVDIITGLLLNLTPLGLQLATWTLFLGLHTTLFASLALTLRWRKGPVQQKAVGRLMTVKGWLLLAFACVVAMSALWLSIIRPPQPQPSFTQFWILQATQADKSCAVNLGIHNFEAGTVTYRIKLTSNGKSVGTWQAIKLDTQQQWEKLVPLSNSVARTNAFIEAQLFRSGHANTIYREVHLRLYPCGT